MIGRSRSAGSSIRSSARSGHSGAPLSATRLSGNSLGPCARDCRPRTTSPSDPACRRVTHGGASFDDRPRGSRSMRPLTEHAVAQSGLNPNHHRVLWAALRPSGRPAPPTRGRAATGVRARHPAGRRVELSAPAGPEQASPLLGAQTARARAPTRALGVGQPAVPVGPDGDITAGRAVLSAGGAAPTPAGKGPAPRPGCSG